MLKTIEADLATFGFDLPRPWRVEAGQFWDHSRDYATNPIKLLVDPASFKQEIPGAIGWNLETGISRID
jgi:hypothetical protein